MVSRVTIYEELIKYLEETYHTLTVKINYYNDRLEIANNKKAIFYDSLERQALEFSTIYNITLDNIDKNLSLVSYTNHVLNSNQIAVNSIISNLKSLDTSYDQHTVVFITSIVKNYFTILKEITNINRQLQLLNDKLEFVTKYRNVSKNIVYYIISKCNKYYETAILDGETIHLGNHLGYIKVVPKKVNGKINWDESFKYRDQLIKEGRVPYKKADFLKAKAAGKKYDGVPWFVYYENEVQHYINWYAHSLKLPNKDTFSFDPARYNKTGKKISDIKQEISSVKELDNLRLGIVNKLNIALDINELQFIKYTGDDI